jgi:catechol 2,3-dioxygenase-like lactoylglutathione lyase family enzyme
MFDHVTIRVSDRTASERFYDTVLPQLGIAKSHNDEHYAEWGDFSLKRVTGEGLTRRLHVGFVSPSREQVDDFWRVGTDAGYRDDGAPGLRPEYSAEYYGAFLLDPDGNSVEGVHHEERRPGPIDHLWIRVADVEVSRRFYELLAPWTGFAPHGQHEFGFGFQGRGGSFSLIPGAPTEHAHIAFPADNDETVEAFHRAALDAGYEDNGPPGERAVYHPGYFGAFVLDPDGNNVEVVNHNRAA